MSEPPRPLYTERHLHTQRQMPHYADTIIPFFAGKDKRGGKDFCGLCVRGDVYGQSVPYTPSFLLPCGAPEAPDGEREKTRPPGKGSRKGNTLNYK